MFKFIKKVFVGLLSSWTIVSVYSSAPNFERRLKCMYLSN